MNQKRSTSVKVDEGKHLLGPQKFLPKHKESYMRTEQDYEDSGKICGVCGLGMLIILAWAIAGKCLAGEPELIRLLKSGAASEAKDFRPRWAKRDLTYRFADGVPAIARESLVAALAEWREETKRYSYTEVYEGGDILIEWKPDASDKLADTTVTLTGDSKSIASAVITINSRHRWPHPLWSLGRVMAHELGHALGLGHSTDKGSIMFYRQSMAPCRADVAELEK